MPGLNLPPTDCVHCTRICGPSVWRAAQRRVAPELVRLVERLIAQYGDAVDLDFDIPGTDAVECLCELVRKGRALLQRIEREADG